MIELKAILATPHPKMKNACDGAIEVYSKSEADKVIAYKDKEIADLIEKNKRLARKDIIMASETIKDLEESHKMEVEQLLMEIVGLKEKLKNSRNARKYWRKEYLIEYKECCSQKYKRCLKMAEMCNARYDEADAKENWCGLSWEYISKEMKYWERWRQRWLELAEKFKTNLTAK